MKIFSHFWNKLFPKTKFLTEDQIVDDMVKNMTPEARGTWAVIGYDEVIMAHHTTGRSIRNHYNLWDEDYPYLNGKHSDDFSYGIMQKVWERINL